MYDGCHLGEECGRRQVSLSQEMAWLTILVACGEPGFSAHVRKAVIDRRADRPIEFVEVQYRPGARSSRSADDKDPEKGENKASISDDVDLEKGRNRSDGVSTGEEESWDEITLCSQDGTLISDTPHKQWQKKTH